MSSSQQYDVVIIGSGPGGYVAGIRAGQLGLKVAVVEKDPAIGGTCLHRGCIPTKALLENAEIWTKINKSKEFGITVGDVSLDWSVVQKRKQGVVDKNSSGIEFLFKKYKTEWVKGFGRLKSRNEVEILDGDGNVSQTLQTKNVILATGSVPRDLPHIKADGTHILNSDHILQIDRVPKSMLVIGAGAVGSEFASIFSRFGSEVTIVEVMPQLLPIEDDEVAKEFTRVFKKSGVNVFTGAKITGVEIREGVCHSTIEMPNGKTQTVETEIVLSATGRAPVLEGVNADQVGIETDERGYIKVDANMRTNVEGIYAIGDVVPTPWLAHVASKEGIIAVEQIAGNKPRTINYDHVPNCTYTEPEVASVGLTEKKAKERGHEVKIGKFAFTANPKAKILGDAAGFVKFVVDTKYDEILGVHIVGPKATELIVEACAALELEATSESIMETIHAHPTLSEAMGEAAHAAFHGMPLHS